MVEPSMSRVDRRGRAPGMTDVARLAGVSQKTVSRVINNEPNVSAEVRERVHEVARQLGFRRNTAARDLILGRSHRIGVVSIGTPLFGPASLLFGLERAAQAAGYTITVMLTLEGEEGGVQRAVDGLLDQGVEGIVLSEPVDEGAGSIVACPVPVLSIGRMPGLTGPDVLIGGADGALAGRAATEHLLGLGHRTVWHVAGPQRWWSAVDRAKGWSEALSAAGAEPPPVLSGDWSPSSGFEAGRVLARTAGVTAVFVANDDMAIGVIHALNRAGRSVPEHVSVVGFDDIPAAQYFAPPLTTVRESFGALAAAGLELLMRRIEGKPGEGCPSSGAVVVVRESTGPPPPG